MTSDGTPTIGVIGLGAMGGRAAVRFAAAHKTYGYDLDEGARARAAEHGVVACASAAEVAAAADLLILSLPMPDDVVAVANEIATGQARPGTTVVDLSTIDPAAARAAAAALRARDIAYLDAPVLGRPEKCGVWTLAIGGDQAAFDRVAAVLESAIAARAVRVGDVGAGSVVKLMNNLMFGAINTVTAEVLTTCRLAGVDPAVFVNTVADSGAASVSNLFRELAPKILAGDFAPTFGLGLLAKDNRLAVSLAEQVGSPSFIGGTVQLVNNLGLNRGFAREDTGAVYKLYGELAAQPDA